MSRKIPINDDEKELILKLFYRTQLRFDEVTIDNKTSTIAKESKIAKINVERYLTKHLKEKFKLINNK